MKFTRNYLASTIALAVAAAAVAPAANAEIELGTGLNVSGFVDMSYVYKDVDDAESTEKVFGVDQVEMDFMYAGSEGVSAQVDIEYGESHEGDSTFVEQAFITKQLGEKFSVKGGRFLSYSGWEAEEPTGLYQYSSTGYAQYFYGYYQQGVSAYYDGGLFDFMASAVNSLTDPAEDDTTTMGAELGVAIQPFEGLTAKLFYLSEDDNDVINFWTSFQISNLLLAAEYSQGDYADESEGDAYLLMANYAIGAFGITARYHEYSIDDAAGATIDENTGYTLSPSYKMGDNLLLVAEYRIDEFGETDVNTFALEALYTF
jgi:hypothetical protein